MSIISLSPFFLRYIALYMPVNNFFSYMAQLFIYITASYKFDHTRYGGYFSIMVALLR